MSKYNPLWIFIKQQNKDNFKMTFDEIKKVLGFPIDHSFLNYKKELSEFGYQTGKISLKEQTIIFKKITS